ncbi:MAG: CocE/NonD family hydrolase, partial [Nitrososphaerota archaeon]|nr:CocE/NonD family hydrolase [Nitrososphaerota archaeon]
MKIERDVGIQSGDIVLRADIFLPDEKGRYPVIMTHGPYAKGLRYQNGYAPQWNWLVKKHPNILEGSTRSYLAWETVDPELWVPNGYVVIRVDSRGAGRTPGILDPFSPSETRDFYNAIEWAASQPWSNGNIGLCGISYYAINQWLVASLQPPHLKAIIPWEGAADYYRDFTHHGGIYANAFLETWYEKQVITVQHGLGTKGPMDPWLNESATGPETLSPQELEANRADYIEDARTHTLDDEYHRGRSADFWKITVPLFTAANWGGFGLHERGNFEGFTESASKEKWLEVHVGRHEEYFYLPYAIELQRRFFDHFLKGLDNGWEKEPQVRLIIRYIDRFETRFEEQWPLSRTVWTKAHLNARDKHISWNAPSEESGLSFEAMSDGVTFETGPLDRAIEITGPLATKLFVSSSTNDADFFLTLRAFDTHGKEVDFQGTLDPHTPLSQGWLRASHRKLDLQRSKPYRPY